MVPDAITLPDPENAVRALADISLPLRAACCGSGLSAANPLAISQQLRAACWTPNRAAAPTRLGFAFFPASD